MQSRFSILLPVCGLLVGSSPLAVAEPPATWKVAYGIHEIPSDSESPLTFLVTLSLERQGTYGNLIGWHVQSLNIQQFDEYEVAIGDWTEVDPTVQTLDGLWWVEHADPDDPQMAEFVVPPPMEGVADAADSNDPELTYELEGVPYTPPDAPDDPPYDITAALNYVFLLVGETEPSGSGQQDPTETGPPGTE